MDDPVLPHLKQSPQMQDVLDLLGDSLSLAELTSLLLEVARKQASRRTPAQVLQEFQNSRFVRPARVNPARMLEWEHSVMANLPPEVEGLVLSPVAPLGTCSVVAGVDQNWTVSTVRGNEVLSDSTNVLALEASSRRKQLLAGDAKSRERVHVAACHRLLRPQLSEDPNQLPHFSLLGMVSAGRDEGNSRFEFSCLVLHLHTLITALRGYWKEHVPLKLTVSDFSGKKREELIEQQVFEVLQSHFPDLDCQHDPQRTHARNYYTGLCFHLYALPEGRDRVFLADGGEVDWSQHLLSNRKERMLISGMGGDRVVGLQTP